MDNPFRDISEGIKGLAWLLLAVILLCSGIGAWIGWWFGSNS